MLWKLIGRNLFYPLAILLLVILWLLTTESGCKTSFWAIKIFLPGELKIAHIQGKWNDKLILKTFEYEKESLKLSSEEIRIDPNLTSLLNFTIQVPFIELKNGLFIWKKKSTLPLFIKNTKAQLEISFNRQNASINIQQLIGTWHEMSLNGQAKLNIVNNHFQIPTLFFNLGENKLSIIESRDIKNQFEWTLNILDTTKKIKADLNGYISNNIYTKKTMYQKPFNQWIITLDQANFSSERLGSWVFKTPYPIELSTAHITTQAFNLQNNTHRLTLTGDFYYDKKGLNLNLNLASWFLPKQAITLKKLHLNISGNLEKPLLVKASGYAGAGSFQMTGNLQLNNEKKLLLNLVGNNLQIYNTRSLQIIGSPDITLNLINSNLFVNGTLKVHRAYIRIQDQKNVALLSKDVVLTGASEYTQKTYSYGFRIIPNLYVIIENNLQFEGYNIQGIIGGKLKINERPDGLLMGDGKLTIKEGKYRLQGATRYIHHGRLLFPPGTLLKDPLLDILISQYRVDQHANTANTNVGLYVQGTLLHPIYYPYSNDTNLKSADILSRLGFGQDETVGDENQRQLFAQTAFLFSGTANPFIDFLQKNLKLEEFNLESKPINKTFYTQGGADTVLVIGKSLSEKLYLQYLQSIIEPITTIRLKYFLSRYFTLSAEAGTEGLGSDLTFSMERD